MPDPTDGKSPEENADAGEKGGAKKPENGGQGKEPEKKDEKPTSKKLEMTQEELDEIIENRLNRQKKKLEEDSKLSETDLLKKERDEFKKKAAEGDLRDAFIAKSDLSYAAGSKLFRVYKDDVELDENGKPTNLKDVLKTAKDEFPELFGEAKKKLGGKIDAGAGNGGGGGDKPAGQSMNDKLRNRAGFGNREEE